MFLLDTRQLKKQKGRMIQIHKWRLALIVLMIPLALCAGFTLGAGYHYDGVEKLAHKVQRSLWSEKKTQQRFEIPPFFFERENPNRYTVRLSSEDTAIAGAGADVSVKR